MTITSYPAGDSHSSLIERALAALHQNSHVQTLFQGLCASYDEDEVLRLKDKLVDSADWMSSFRAGSQAPSLELASDLCARAVLLLERYHSFSPPQRALVVGAVRYLTFRVDAHPDRYGSHGLSDDRDVFNAVLPLLGLSEFVLSEPTKLPHSSGTPSAPPPAALTARRQRWRTFRKIQSVEV